MEFLKSRRFLVLTLLVFAAAATRALPYLIPHIWNFTAVGALAVFAGSQFNDRRVALIIPLLAMAVSDVFIGNGFNLSVYVGFIAMVLCGILINRKVSITNVGLASIAGAFLFFLITNFAVVMEGNMYPHNLTGVMESYIAGLPFLRNMLIGDAIYGTILFGSFSILEQKYPSISIR